MSVLGIHVEVTIVLIMDGEMVGLKVSMTGVGTYVTCVIAVGSVNGECV